MTRSWMWAAKHLGFELVVASPSTCQPPPDFLARLDASNVTLTTDPLTAVKNAHVINTDVWLSMGQEDQKDKELEFAGFEVNASMLSHAATGHIVLHCLPAYRGKEISDEVLELHAGTIFQQAENRLHAQKAVLVSLAQ
jgi:ornithine carbamoyltransferase